MATFSDDYYRVYKALHLVTHEAVPCVDNCVKVWHQNQTLVRCTTQCPDGKKPKSCQQCVAWAKAIEAVYYPPANVLQVNWSNISPSNLGLSHIEVAKGFVLRLPKTTGSPTQYTTMSDFDSASLLMIMARFGEFHRADKASYDKIMKVSDIRNALSHLQLKANMQLDHQKVKQYFKDIEDFVTCLEVLHPTHFTSGQNIKTQLREIQQAPVSRKMKEEIHLEMKENLEIVRQKTEALCQTVTELKDDYHETTIELRKDYHKTTAELKHVRDEIANIKEDTYGQTIEKDNFIRCWRSLDCVLNRSIPCLRSVLKQWQENKLKTIKPCQRPRPRPPKTHSQDECSEEGKPVPGSSCDNCVAWGNAIEDACYSKTSTAIVSWDTTNPMCLARSHFMIAKAFVSKSTKVAKCTKLEDLDLGCLLDIMLRFKPFLEQERSSYEIVKKVLDIKSMLTERHETGNVHLTDKELEDTHSDIDSFISFLQMAHPQWFTLKDSNNTRTAIKQIQQETITRKLWQDMDAQIKCCGEDSRFNTSELKEQIQHIEEQLDRVVTRMDTTRDESADGEKFIKQCAAIYYMVKKSIPCLKKVLQRWHSMKRKAIGGCQRAQSASIRVCKTEGKPTSTSWCANCVAWGEAVQGAYYPQKSKGNIPWDIIDPTCLSDNIDMIAKAFVSKSDKAKECTQLEDLDVSSVLNIMMRFKDFLGGQKNTHQILSKISDDILMLTEMKEAKIFALKDQQLETIYQNIANFVSCLETLHSEWFTVGEAADIKKALLKIKTTSFSEWSKEELPRVSEIMEAFGSTKSGVRHHGTYRAGNTGNKHYATLKKCREELRRYYLDSLCKIPLFPGDPDSSVNLKDIYTKLSFEIKLPSPCKPVKMPLLSYAEMFTRKSVEGRSYTRFLISAPAGLGKTTLAAKIAYDWITEEEEALKDVDLLFVINMRSVDHSSNLEEIILNQLFPTDTTFTAEDISSLLQRYSQSTIVILDAIDESDRNLYGQQNCGSLVKLLTGKILLPCKLVITTRPWRIREIKRKCSAFAQVEINGFNKEDIRKYIKKFFSEDTEMGESLVKHANQNKLIDEIAYIPLMSLLICIYWKELQQEGIPHRVTQLYDAIINIIHDHYLEKHGLTTGNYDNIKPLIYQMGKMALGGYWPPENRVVFSPNDMPNSENAQIACQMGFLIHQESSPSIIQRSSRTKTTLTFFHKTCGEKCAGEYLAHLAEEKPSELTSKLLQLKTAEDALSVRLILQFACGASKKAAGDILHWLWLLFHNDSDKSVCRNMAHRHACEQLELAETLKIQDFMDLCLRCNYEANCAAAFSHIVNNLFPLFTMPFDVKNECVFLRIVFLGISQFTAVALGYFLSNTSSQIKWSIVLRPAATPNKRYLVDHGPLMTIAGKARKEVNRLTVDVTREICREYIKKHPEMSESYKRTLDISPTIILGFIHMWQACEKLPTPDDSDVGPIFDSIDNICLVELDLNSFSIPERNMERLLEMIRNNHLSSLRFLNVCHTSRTKDQMLCFAKQLKRIPNLFKLHVAEFSAPKRFLPILTESILSMKALLFLHIVDVTMFADDMMQFVHKFPTFASNLLELNMLQNTDGVMTDRVISMLANHIIIAKNLMKFYINFDDSINPSIQNDFLSRLCSLSYLCEVHVYFWKYADDVVRTMADVMKSLPKLRVLELTCIAFCKPTIGTTTWKKFKTALLGMTNMVDLGMLNVGFKEGKDFVDLLAVCRKKHYGRLLYSVFCVPEGFIVPKDDFLRLS